MKISEALQLGYKEINNFKTAHLDTEVLLGFVLKKEKSFLFSHPDFELNLSQKNNFAKLVKQRKAHRPIAYIIGFKEFYGLKFYVNQNILIPRPETEKLVDQVLEYANNQLVVSKVEPSPITILDIGTGSGCIAISIAKNIKIPARIIASDICKKALKIAQKNANLHYVDIKFIQSNLLENIKTKPDIIIANLPYITPKVYDKLTPDIKKYEPKKALLAKTRNYFYTKLEQELSDRNWHPKLFFE